MPEASLPQIIWLCGPRAVGKSTIGYQFFTRLNSTVAKSAYLDLAQISFCHPAPPADPHHHTLKATTLAACWRTFRAAGAHHLVITGTITAQAQLRPYQATLHPTPFTLIRLDAAPSTHAERIAQRAAGAGPAIPGNTLRGLTGSALDQATEQALHEGSTLQTAAIGDLTLDTTDLTPEQAADALFHLAQRPRTDHAVSRPLRPSSESPR